MQRPLSRCVEPDCVGLGLRQPLPSILCKQVNSAKRAVVGDGSCKSPTSACRLTLPLNPIPQAQLSVLVPAAQLVSDLQAKLKAVLGKSRRPAFAAGSGAAAAATANLPPGERAGCRMGGRQSFRHTLGCQGGW